MPFRSGLPGLLISSILLCSASDVAWGEESEYIDVGRGDVRVVLPSNRDPEEALPLILLLHEVVCYCFASVFMTISHIVLTLLRDLNRYLRK